MLFVPIADILADIKFVEFRLFLYASCRFPFHQENHSGNIHILSQGNQRKHADDAEKNQLEADAGRAAAAGDAGGAESAQ